MRPADKLVLKQLYNQPKKLTLNAFVAQAVTAVPRLKLREAEQYFKLRKQKDHIAKDSDPKRQKTRKDKETAESRVGGLSEQQLELLNDTFYRQHKGTIGVRGGQLCTLVEFCTAAHAFLNCLFFCVHFTSGILLACFPPWLLCATAVAAAVGSELSMLL